jgi:hypothetical protein
MYLPAHYVPLLLRPSGYTLWEVWEVLYPVIVDDDALQHCSTLVNWLHVASTGTPPTNNAPGTDQALINHRSRLLKQILLVLSQPTESLEHALTRMAVAVLLNTNNNWLARDEKLAQLPKLWHNCANCTKQQEFQVLMDLLQSYTWGPDAVNSCTSVITAKLVQDLQTFIFVGDSMDDLKSGLQPFIIAKGSAEH